MTTYFAFTAAETRTAATNIHDTCKINLRILQILLDLCPNIDIFHKRDIILLFDGFQIGPYIERWDQMCVF